MAIIFFMTNNIIQAAVRVFRANFKLTSFFLGSGGEVNRHIGNYTATPPLILVKITSTCLPIIFVLRSTAEGRAEIADKSSLPPPTITSFPRFFSFCSAFPPLSLLCPPGLYELYLLFEGFFEVSIKVWTVLVALYNMDVEKHPLSKL